MVNEWYKEWFDSDYYHRLYYNRDEKEAQAFIDRLLQHLQPAPQSRMLDAGCGRGRLGLLVAHLDPQLAISSIFLPCLAAISEGRRCCVRPSSVARTTL